MARRFRNPQQRIIRCHPEEVPIDTGIVQSFPEDPIGDLFRFVVSPNAVVANDPEEWPVGKEFYDLALRIGLLTIDGRSHRLGFVKSQNPAISPAIQRHSSPKAKATIGSGRP